MRLHFCIYTLCLYSQIDPLKCSCVLLPLVTWLKSRNLKGISCINDSGEIFTITSLQELCHGLKGLDPDMSTSIMIFLFLLGSYFWQVAKSKSWIRGVDHHPKVMEGTFTGQTLKGCCHSHIARFCIFSRALRLASSLHLLSLLAALPCRSCYWRCHSGEYQEAVLCAFIKMACTI